MLGAIDWGFRVILVTDALCSSADETHDAMMNVYMNRFGEQVETVTTANPPWTAGPGSAGAQGLMSRPPISCRSSCRKKPATGSPSARNGSTAFLKELTDKFGGATSFLRAPGQGLWQSGGATEKDSIAVVEVMAESLDHASGESLRERLERELSQEEIVIRAQEIISAIV